MSGEADEPKRAERGKPVTAGYLERAAVYYLERYSSSSENLRRVLLQKARKRAGSAAALPPEIGEMVAEVVAKTVRSGLVDDAAYADSKLNSLLRKGASTRKARATLAAKGVPPATVAAALASNAPDEAAQARRYAQRKRLGPWRHPPDPAKRERDLAALCRAGFPYRLAVAALETDPAEES
jgi:regulatory protein